MPSTAQFRAAAGGRRQAAGNELDELRVLDERARAKSQFFGERDPRARAVATVAADFCEFRRKNVSIRQKCQKCPRSWPGRGPARALPGGGGKGRDWRGVAYALAPRCWDAPGVQWFARLCNLSGRDRRVHAGPRPRPGRIALELDDGENANLAEVEALGRVDARPARRRRTPTARADGGLRRPEARLGETTGARSASALRRSTRAYDCPAAPARARVHGRATASFHGLRAPRRSCSALGTGARAPRATRHVDHGAGGAADGSLARDRVSGRFRAPRGRRRPLLDARSRARYAKSAPLVRRRRDGVSLRARLVSRLARRFALAQEEGAHRWRRARGRRSVSTRARARRAPRCLRARRCAHGTLVATPRREPRRTSARAPRKQTRALSLCEAAEPATADRRRPRPRVPRWRRRARGASRAPPPPAAIAGSPARRRGRARRRNRVAASRAPLGRERLRRCRNARARRRARACKRRRARAPASTLDAQAEVRAPMPRAAPRLAPTSPPARRRRRYRRGSAALEPARWPPRLRRGGTAARASAPSSSKRTPPAAASSATDVLASHGERERARGQQRDATLRRATSLRRTPRRAPRRRRRSARRSSETQRRAPRRLTSRRVTERSRRGASKPPLALSDRSRARAP